MSSSPRPAVPLAEALAVQVDGTVATGVVQHGWDIFGIPHGGYLAGLTGAAALAVADQPDLFTLTVHYLRKAAFGPMRFEARRVGGSRRFTSWHLTAEQEGEVVLTALASVGDRTGITGPAWADREPWRPDTDQLSPPATGDEEPFATPQAAVRFAQQVDARTAGFAVGRTGEHAAIRTLITPDHVDQLAAIVACDITPPVIWNVLGVEGWVPTLELTAHVRARPAAGPLTVEAETHHVTDGFLDEDALVYDSEGTLVVQSRQLARWTGA